MNVNHEYKFFVRYSEVDPMKFVHNSKYLVYFEEARIDLVRKNNYPYNQIESDGYIFPMSEAKLEYKSSIYYGEYIKVIVSLAYLKNFSMKFNYKIIKPDGKIACEGYTVHACVDKRNNDFVDIPEKLRMILEKYID